MKLFNLKLCLVAVMPLSISAFATAGPETGKHDHMDARAARADIQKLMVIRQRCVKYKNYRKLEQTDRLIAKDKHFIHKDL